MKLVKGDALEKYFLEHVKIAYHGRGFYMVVKPLHGFKKTYVKVPWAVSGCAALSVTSAITNLIIPKGAYVYAPAEVFWAAGPTGCRKMRASEAQVHSNVYKSNRKEVEKHRLVVSGFSSNFRYTKGEQVVPRERFSFVADQCRSGIHFFLNLQDALDY